MFQPGLWGVMPGQEFSHPGPRHSTRQAVFRFAVHRADTSSGPSRLAWWHPAQGTIQEVPQGAYATWHCPTPRAPQPGSLRYCEFYANESRRAVWLLRSRRARQHACIGETIRPAERVRLPALEPLHQRHVLLPVGPSPRCDGVEGVGHGETNNISDLQPVGAEGEVRLKSGLGGCFHRQGRARAAEQHPGAPETPSARTHFGPVSVQFGTVAASATLTRLTRITRRCGQDREGVAVRK